MTISWYSDPSSLCERADNRRGCPVCIQNEFSRDKTGRKRFYCALGFDQLGGNRGQQDCDRWRLRGPDK
jgi:hypothetical protein